MTEEKLFSSAFMMLDRPAMVTKKEKIIFMNAQAIRLAGRDMTGKPASLLIPSHVLNTQADSFTATAFIGTKSCIIRVKNCEGYKIYVASDDVTQGHDSMMLFNNISTTLSNIKFANTCISVIAEDSRNEKLNEYASIISRNYYRIKHSMDNASALNALAKGEMIFRPEPVNMTVLCKNTIDTLNNMLEENSVNISFNAPEDVSIVADPSLVQILLLNLLSNSVVNCRRNGKISVALLRTDKDLIISVDDNGSGIAPEDLSDIFERYRHSVELSKVKGSGMGLSVVRGIAELHKGAVLIESRGVDLGTSVRVMLSYDVEAIRQNSFGSPDKKQTDENETKKNILTIMSSCLPVESYAEKFDD